MAYELHNMLRKISTCSNTRNGFSDALKENEHTETYLVLKFSSFGTSSTFERTQTANAGKPQHEQPCALLPTCLKPDSEERTWLYQLSLIFKLSPQPVH